MSEHAGGDILPECPWRAFWDPTVVDVLNAYDWFESGQISIRLGNDPPYYLIEGVEIYHQALEWARHKRREAQDKENKALQQHAKAHANNGWIK